MAEADPSPIGLFDDLSALLAAAPDAMLIADQDGHIVQSNSRCAHMLGYDHGALVGMSVDQLVPPAQRALHRHQRAAYANNPVTRDMGAGLELVAVRNDGVELPIEISLAPFETDRGPMTLAALRDVSRSRHDERLFRTFVDTAPDAIVVADRQGNIQLVNARSIAMFGYERAELVGQPVSILIPERVAEQYEVQLAQYVADPEASPVIGLSGDLFGRRKDGSEVPVEISIASSNTEDGTLVLLHVRDITERTEILETIRAAEEHQRVQEAINQSRDAFLATISHELRTPLASIIGFAELMADSGELSPELTHHLSVITRNGRRELRLVQDLLTLVTITDGGLEIRAARADLVPLVREAVEAVTLQATEAGLTLHVNLPEASLHLDCDAERIGQVLDGLLSNALKFTPAGGEVSVVLSEDGHSAHLTVTDSGIGIGDEAERVFERLFRSRRAIAQEIPGTGIGLSIAAAIVEAHHGKIRVIETSDSGTTIGLELPLHP